MIVSKLSFLFIFVFGIGPLTAQENCTLLTGGGQTGPPAGRATWNCTGGESDPADAFNNDANAGTVIIPAGDSLIKETETRWFADVILEGGSPGGKIIF